MTIQEAIETGLPYRREAFTDKRWWKANPGFLNICVGDLLATDWEVEEKKITVTLKDLADAYYSIHGSEEKEFHLTKSPFYRMAEKLGLK